MSNAKKALCALVVSAACAVSAQAAQVGWTLAIDDTTNTLTSSLAGVSITTLGTQHWLIDASSLLTSVLGGGTNLTWLNDVDDLGENWLHSIGNLQFELNGDWTGATPGLLTCAGIPAPLQQGTSCFVGVNGADSFFATVVERPSAAAVPEPATLALVGVSLAGLALTRRRKG